MKITLIEEALAPMSCDLDIDAVYEDGEFNADLWNEVMDQIGWPMQDFVLTVQDGSHAGAMQHNADEGWLSVEPFEFGMYDYSGDTPKLIKKMGEN